MSKNNSNSTNGGSTTVPWTSSIEVRHSPFRDHVRYRFTKNLAITAALEEGDGGRESGKR